MGEITSNIEEVVGVIEALYECLDFTFPGPMKMLGEACLDRISEGCQDRSTNKQRGASGRKWAENAPGYAKTPDKQGKIIGVLTGEMLSDVQFQGERVIGPKTATITYGEKGNDFVRRKASWFHRGSKGPGAGEPSGAIRQPPRPNMFALDKDIKKAIGDEISEYLDWLTLADLSGGGP